MRVLHVADLHLQHDWFDWVAKECANYDLVVIAGDLANAFSNVGLHQQTKAIARFITALSTPCAAVTGNHDFWTARGSIDTYAEGGWLRMLRGKGNVMGVDGDTLEFQGLRFCCNGWLQVPSPNDRIDFLVTHAPPAGCQCAGAVESVDVGDPQLWPAVQDFPPSLVLSGHVHQPRRFACTWPPADPTSLILVPGCDEQSDIPSYWVIDTETRRATHSDGGTVSWDFRPESRDFTILKAASFGVEEESLAEEGGCATDNEFAATLRCSVGDLLVREKAGELFYILHRNERHWPRWQLINGQPIAGLREILKTLRSRHTSDSSIADFFLTPTESLFYSSDEPDADGVRMNDSPLALLRRRGSTAVPRVLQHALRFGDIGA
ncbi:MAG TPA: metallophosphoesterase [Lacipirellulaceae bacterium]|nr:metallophosphoesterase [Lacipirellulaceae bacterium]